MNPRRRAQLACGLGAAAGAARGQDRLWRVGVLRPGSPPEAADDTPHTGLPTALRALGDAEGRNPRAARAVGLALPRELILRADEVIE